MRLMRCKAHLTVHVTLEPPASERVVHLRDGDEVDVEEIVRPARPGRPALTLGDVIAGRENCFEEPAAAAAPGLASSLALAPAEE